jgi:hypothetical protein
MAERLSPRAARRAMSASSDKFVEIIAAAIPNFVGVSPSGARGRRKFVDVHGSDLYFSRRLYRIEFLPAVPAGMSFANHCRTREGHELWVRQLERTAEVMVLSRAAVKTAGVRVSWTARRKSGFLVSSAERMLLPIRAGAR